MSGYKISAIGGQYLREGMRTAETREEAMATLREAMGYLGYDAPAIERIDGGEIYAYADAATAARDVDGTEHPILVASPVLEGA